MLRHLLSFGRLRLLARPVLHFHKHLKDKFNLS